MNEITQIQWIRKAYELAYFIHGDKEVAREIAVNAMCKLDVAGEAQSKRFYYTPTGRITNTRAARSKVTLNDLQLLQRLVYIESEPYEKKKEDGKRVSNEELLVYFIKHLVRITLKRNSFYVALGLSRILHSYGTNETMEIYNTVIQDPERVHDDCYYRSRKGQLMKEIKSRFGGLLSLSRGTRGEERFQSHESSAGGLETVKECLERFTPWVTDCVVPDNFDPYSETINHLSFDGRDPDAEHRIEINRIHAAMHPVCYCKIIKALGFEEPNKRLEIPKFDMRDVNIASPPNDRNFPPTLSEDEVHVIKELLAAQSANRRNASGSLLRVLVDGDECARLNPNESESVEFDLGDEAELVEVRVVEKSGDVLLATLLLSFEDAEENCASIILEGGQKISFQFNTTKNVAGEITGAHCGVVYEETDFLRRALLSWRRFTFALSSRLKRDSFLKPMMAFGLFLVVCATVLFIYLQTQKQEVANDPPRQDQIVAPSSSEEKKKEERVADNGAPEKKGASEKKQTVKPQNKTAPGSELVAIARIPITGNTKIDESRNGGMPDLKINQVRKVYVQVDGNDTSGKQMRDEVAKALSASGRFNVTGKDKADAILSISVKQKPLRAKGVSVIVSLFNARGRYLWPNRDNVTGWQYTGGAGATKQLLERIVKDLVREASKEK